MNPSLKVVAYSRVSTAHHDQNPELQLTEIRRYCAARGWTITEEIIDHGFSGGSDNRPGLKRLLSLVRARHVDGVVVLKLDRLFRSLKHLVSTLDEFNALGVQFVAIRDNVDYSTPSGRLFVQVLGSLAEFERALVRERTVLGLEHAKAHGKRLGRPPRHSADAIRKLRAQGMSYREIQRQLNVPLGCISRALKGERKSSSKSVASEALESTS